MAGHKLFWHALCMINITNINFFHLGLFRIFIPFVIKFQNFTDMKKEYSIEEIKKKLQWFHGEEFEKYPFVENTDSVGVNNGE